MADPAGPRGCVVRSGKAGPAGSSILIIGSAEALPIIGSAEALPILCVSDFCE